MPTINKEEKLTMTDLELRELQNLLLKLKAVKPELNVIVTDTAEDKYINMLESGDFYCDLIVQLDICIDDKDNTNLR